MWHSRGPGLIWAARGHRSSSTPGTGLQVHTHARTHTHTLLQAGVQARGGGTNTRGGTQAMICPSPLNLPGQSEGLFWQADLGKCTQGLGAGTLQSQGTSTSVGTQIQPSWKRAGKPQPDFSGSPRTRQDTEAQVAPGKFLLDGGTSLSSGAVVGPWTGAWRGDPHPWKP